MNLNPFKNLPRIKDWVFNTNIKISAIHATNSSGGQLQERPFDVLKDILDLKQIVNDFYTIITSFMDRIREHVEESVIQLLTELRMYYHF